MNFFKYSVVLAVFMVVSYADKSDDEAKNSKNSKKIKGGFTYSISVEVPLVRYLYR